MVEEWKDIPGYEGFYEISNHGRVKSLFFGKEKILKPQINIHGYYGVVLCKELKKKRFDIHVLVSMAFLNHKPAGYKLVVDHINEIKIDNRVCNLRLISNRENCRRNRDNYKSKLRGATFDISCNKWIARILIDGKRYFLGRYTTDIEAHLAYQNKLKELEEKC